MRLLRSSFLIVALTVLCLAQTGTPLQNPNVRRVGDKLACLCGGCKASVTSCDMLQCHYSHPAREKVLAMVQAGKSDDDIVSAFVKENGLVASLIPPSSGFYGLSWTMPYVALALGTLILFLVLKSLRGSKPQVATVNGAPQDDEVLNRYRNRIERELDEND